MLLRVSLISRTRPDVSKDNHVKIFITTYLNFSLLERSSATIAIQVLFTVYSLFCLFVYFPRSVWFQSGLTNDYRVQARNEKRKQSGHGWSSPFRNEYISKGTYFLCESVFLEGLQATLIKIMYKKCCIFVNKNSHPTEPLRLPLMEVRSLLSRYTILLLLTTTLRKRKNKVKRLGWLTSDWLIIGGIIILQRLQSYLFSQLKDGSVNWKFWL